MVNLAGSLTYLAGNNVCLAGDYVYLAGNDVYLASISTKNYLAGIQLEGMSTWQVVMQCYLALFAWQITMICHTRYERVQVTPYLGVL